MRVLKWVRLVLATAVKRDLSPRRRMLSQVFVASAQAGDDAQILALAQVAEDLERDALRKLLHRHAEALALVDVLVERRSDLLPSYIAEETFDPHGLLPLNDRHEVQLEEFDDEFDPLEIA